MKKVAISVGDLNGIGIDLALRNHAAVAEMVDPYYCIGRSMLEQAAERLQLPVPDGFRTVEYLYAPFAIDPGKIDAASGRYSYESFAKAVEMAKSGEADAVVTLPIHKKAWELAGIRYKGHTDALRDFFQADAIMMLGSPRMYVALFTEHIPLREVAGRIEEESLTRFLLDFHHAVRPEKTVAVLALNPHAGDGGVLGDEERIIQKAIDRAHRILGKEIFSDPLVPDVAFIPRARARYTHYIAMYHDQGLTPLKALYFDEGINISLNLPILRTSVDHGTAFDIAYKGIEPGNLSYLNAVKYIVRHGE